MKDKMLKEPEKGLKDSQSFEENFSTKGPEPLQPPRGWIIQQHIEKRMRKLTDNNLQKFIALIKRI